MSLCVVEYSVPNKRQEMFKALKDVFKCHVIHEAEKRKLLTHVPCYEFIPKEITPPYYGTLTRNVSHNDPQYISI